uniref:Putative secreted protein n=1 Tax=Anopheles marajoara TaxID=58244 RepID=A0A2M4CAL3_9DIPT
MVGLLSIKMYLLNAVNPFPILDNPKTPFKTYLWNSDAVYRYLLGFNFEQQIITKQTTRIKTLSKGKTIFKSGEIVKAKKKRPHSN